MSLPPSVPADAQRGLVADFLALVRSIGGGWSRVAAAQGAGAILLRWLPVQRVEVALRSGPEEGLLFRAGAGPNDRPPLEDRFADGVIRLWSAADATALRPALETATGLVDLVPETGFDPPRGGTRVVAAPPTLDPALGAIWDRLGLIAQSDLTVLLRGESGTGKEVAARALHRASARVDGPFVALNCAALPENLLEAELFGVERRAATEVEARAGRFEQAHGGTLFLDEIGDMAAETQSKLLRVIESKSVTRLGGRNPRPCDVRLAAATHRPLEQLIERGRFRSDLYYRLAGWEATLPPLRERRADIGNFAAFFFARACHRRGRACPGLAPTAFSALARCSWPGNVRQLERTMARAAVLSDLDRPLAPDDLPAETAATVSTPRTLAERLAAVEREAIADALATTAGDVTTAAKRLGLGRSTLYRRIGELGLEGWGLADFVTR